jgi:Domain of unknown function DUF1828
MNTNVCAALTDKLGALFECKPHKEFVRVRTPFLYPDGGVIDVFVRMHDGYFTVTDLGEALGWLRLQTVSAQRSPKQQRLLQDVCMTLGVELFKGQLLLRGDEPEQLSDRILRLGQAVVIFRNERFLLSALLSSRVARAATGPWISRPAQSATVPWCSCWQLAHARVPIAWPSMLLLDGMICLQCVSAHKRHGSSRCSTTPLTYGPRRTSNSSSQYRISGGGLARTSLLRCLLERRSELCARWPRNARLRFAQLTVVWYPVRLSKITHGIE